MRDVELFLDTYLRRFELFTDVETILRGYTQSEDENEVSVEETMARSLFSDFVSLASILDTFGDWGEVEWKNFLLMMMQAYKEKGKGISVTCALAALGLTAEEVKVIDTMDDTGHVSSNVIISIQNLATPNVSEFMRVLEGLLKRLLWLHEPVTSEGSQVFSVSVNVHLKEVFEKIIYDKLIYYSEIDI